MPTLSRLALKHRRGMHRAPGPTQALNNENIVAHGSFSLTDNFELGRETGRERHGVRDIETPGRSHRGYGCGEQQSIGSIRGRNHAKRRSATNDTFATDAGLEFCGNSAPGWRGSDAR